MTSEYLNWRTGNKIALEIGKASQFKRSSQFLLHLEYMLGKMHSTMYTYIL